MGFVYQKQKLMFGPTGREVDLKELMDSHEGRPTYLYDRDFIVERYKYFTSQLGQQRPLKVHYALKANGNIEILKLLKSLGAGVDIVSGGELKRALSAGFTGPEMIFSGVAKSWSEIDLALEKQIYQLNVESPQELIRIGDVARKRKCKAPVAFRINPEVSPETHPYITTGMSENKFGMSVEFLPELLKIMGQYSKELQLQGVTMHIGSQITEVGVFAEALGKLIAVYKSLKADGFPVETLDIGGGVGIDYGGDPHEDLPVIQRYGQLVQETLGDFKGNLLVEPGRILVARAGVLLCRVEYVKDSVTKSFAIVNSGMHHLLRPALYQAAHQILPVLARDEGTQKFYDVVGPICESSDFLGHDRIFTGLQQGDDLAICDAGAYGYSMVSDYNDHERPLEIVI